MDLLVGDTAVIVYLDADQVVTGIRIVVFTHGVERQVVYAVEVALAAVGLARGHDGTQQEQQDGQYNYSFS